MRRSLAAASVFLAVTLAITLPTFPAMADDSTATEAATVVAPASDPAAPEVPTAPPGMDVQEATKVLDEAIEMRDKGAAAADLGKHTAAEKVSHGRSATLVLRDLLRARTLLKGAKRAEAGRLLARPTDAKGDNFGALQFALSATDQRCSQRFCVTYADATKTKDPDRATAAFADSVLGAFEKTHRRMVTQLKFRAPLSDKGIKQDPTSNPNGKFDIFLGDIGKAGFYGYCVAEPARANRPYCVLDNDFRDFPGKDLDEMRVTAAHEYFHAVQFAYDVNEDIWMMEGSSVWAEEKVYGNVNDYANFVRRASAITAPGKAIDMDSVYSPDNLRVYSAGLFFINASLRYGNDMIRQMWNRAVGKRYSLQAVRGAISARTSWPRFVSTFAAWNTLPPGMGYPDRRLYPEPKYVATRELGLKAKKSFATIKFRRMHMSSASIKIRPQYRKSMRGQKLRLYINGPSRASGATAILQRRLPNGTTRFSHVKLNKHGNATVTTPFRRAGKDRVTSVVLTVANSSTTMKGCGSNADVRFACNGFGVHNGLWTIRGRVLR